MNTAAITAHTRTTLLPDPRATKKFTGEIPIAIGILLPANNSFTGETPIPPVTFTGEIPMTIGMLLRYSTGGHACSVEHAWVVSLLSMSSVCQAIHDRIDARNSAQPIAT